MICIPKSLGQAGNQKRLCPRKGLTIQVCLSIVQKVELLDISSRSCSFKNMLRNCCVSIGICAMVKVVAFFFGINETSHL